MEKKVLNIVKTVGKAAANTLFPNDIEYYIITIELVDSKGNTIDYLTLPVNPDLFTYDDHSLVSIRKTLGGVTSLNTSSFAPKTIVMSGSFGRSFKLLLAPAFENGGNDLSTGLSLKTNFLNPSFKSGYGTIKKLESILVKSKELDIYNEPHSLYLYLPLSGHNFVVEYTDFSLRQDSASANMIWKYNVKFTAVAPLTQLRTGNSKLKSVANSTGINVIQRKANSLLGSIKKSII
jgi:hypothetical protein